MQHTLDTRTGEPSTADNVLLARIARLESFNRSVAHDLRGPLAGLSGLAQLASMALQQGDPGGAAQLVAGSSRQLAMLIEAVDGLLALASAGDAPLALEAAELATCAGEALELVRSSLAHKLPGARMPNVRIAPLPRAVVDARLMRQLFANLLCNAAKFSQPVAEPCVDIGIRDVDGTVVLFVRDNGVGFEGRFAAQLFHPFRRLHGSRFHGSGLGLSIVRAIVERHDGRVWIESIPGAGTTVFFTLGCSALAPTGGTPGALAYNPL